jgi:hypothetical protein
MIRRYLSTLAVSSVVTWWYISARWSEDLPLVEQYRVLCDGFSIPGIMMVMFALLFTLNNLGALDTIAYLMSYLPRMIAPAAFGDPEMLIEFVEKRREKRSKGYGFLYVEGFIFLGIAIFYLVKFYSVF